VTAVAETRVIKRSCRCPGRTHVPLHRHLAGVAVLASLLGRREAGFSHDELETVLFSYRCIRCKVIVDIRLRDLLG